MLVATLVARGQSEFTALLLALLGVSFAHLSPRRGASQLQASLVTSMVRDAEVLAVVVRWLAEGTGLFFFMPVPATRVLRRRLELPCCSPSTAQSWGLPMVAVRRSPWEAFDRDHAGGRGEACAFAGRRSVARAMDGTSAVERFQRASSTHTHTSMSGEVLSVGFPFWDASFILQHDARRPTPLSALRGKEVTYSTAPVS